MPRRQGSRATTDAAIPRYIVVFKEAKRDGLSVLSKSLPRARMKEVTGRKAAFVAEFEFSGAKGRAKYFRSLGVAAVNLSDDQVSTLESKVEAIVPNERRYILLQPGSVRVLAAPVGIQQQAEAGRRRGRRAPSAPPPGARGGTIGPVLPFAAGQVSPFGGTIGPTLPFGGKVEPHLPFAAGFPPEHLVPYLRGQRDALQNLLSTLEGRAPTGLPAGTLARMQEQGYSWCLGMVGIDTSYQRATGRGVKVAVLDTGLDLEHPDFAARVTGGAREDTSATAVSLVEGVESAQDGHGHGTHCCGVVGGPRESAGAVRYGVAPEVELLVGKVMDDDGGGYDSWILEGIAWAAERGAQVISMSLGSPRGVGAPFATAYERVAQTLLDGDPSVLLVAAAGNESHRPALIAPVGNPAACPSMLAVAAVAMDGTVAPFSCGQRDSIALVDLSAPGVDVLSAYPGGRFAMMSGTSMATPHVAGVAALHREVNADLSARDIWRAMERSAHALGAAADYGRGICRAPT